MFGRTWGFVSATVCAFSVSAASLSAAVIQSTGDASELANTILGPGITLSGQASYTGASGSSGVFTGGVADGLGFNSGIILSTGKAEQANGPNGNGGVGEVLGVGDPFDDSSYDFGSSGDSDLEGLTTGFTLDAAILEFDFITDGGDLFFDFVFASEEYIDFVGSQFNDVFGFFITPEGGAQENIALVPGTDIPITVNTINPNVNADLYRGNVNPATIGTEFDGMTQVLTAQRLGLGAGTHRIKIAIADTSDGNLDSAVFIRGRSFRDGQSALPPQVVVTSAVSTHQNPEPSSLLIWGILLVLPVAWRRWRR